MVPISGDKTGWAAWSTALASQARVRYEARQIRWIKEEREHAARQEAKAAMKLADLETHTHVAENPDQEMARKRAIIEAAMAKAKARQAK
jgi:electron transport complex protein RnfB